MSVRDRNGARHRLNEGLQFWHERWALEGLYVSCPGCHAQQLTDDARRPFPHVDGLVRAQERAEGFVEGIEAARALTAASTEALFIAVEVAASERREGLRP